MGQSRLGFFRDSAAVRVGLGAHRLGIGIVISCEIGHNYHASRPSRLSESLHSRLDGITQIVLNGLTGHRV